VNPIYPYQTQEVRDLAWAQWLSSACIDMGMALSRMQLTSRLNNQMDADKRPQLAAAFDKAGKEIQCFFVTPTMWPA
jgi:hypothetical protein